MAVAEWIIAAGAIGSFVGGIGAALGAGAAWKAASASAQAAREAREAVGLTIAPSVKLLVSQRDSAGPLTARAHVLGPGPWGTGGPWAASDVTIQFTMASGKQGSRSTPLLEPNPSQYAWEPPYLDVEIAQPDDVWPPPEGDHVDVMVLYSNVRNTASYKLTMSADLRRAGDQGAVSVLITEEPTTERIDAPGEST